MPERVDRITSEIEGEIVLSPLYPAGHVGERSGYSGSRHIEDTPILLSSPPLQPAAEVGWIGESSSLGLAGDDDALSKKIDEYIAALGDITLKATKTASLELAKLAVGGGVQTTDNIPALKKVIKALKAASSVRAKKPAADNLLAYLEPILTGEEGILAFDEVTGPALPTATKAIKACSWALLGKQLEKILGAYTPFALAFVAVEEVESAVGRFPVRPGATGMLSTYLKKLVQRMGDKVHKTTEWLRAHLEDLAGTFSKPGVTAGTILTALNKFATIYFNSVSAAKTLAEKDKKLSPIARRTFLRPLKSFQIRATASPGHALDAINAKLEPFFDDWHATKNAEIGALETAKNKDGLGRLIKKLERMAAEPVYALPLKAPGLSTKAGEKFSAVIAKVIGHAKDALSRIVK